MTRSNVAQVPDDANDNKKRMRLMESLKSRSDTDSFDRLIHERNRLAIVSALAVNKSLAFSELKQLLGLSDGNLSIHAQKLEAAGYVDCKKSFRGRTPRTEYRLTDAGRRALDEYLDHMETLIQAVRKR